MKSLFEQILSEILAEQEANQADTEITGDENVYTPEQERFLAHFSKLQTNSLGILYSLSPTGIQEFINRSGAAFNLTADVLTQLMKVGVISIVPYTGYSRNVDYTLKCNVPIEDLAGFSTGEEETASGDGEDSDMPMDSGDDFAGGGGMTTADLGGGDDIPASDDLPDDAGGAGEPIGADVPEVGDELPDTDPEESFRRDGDLLFEIEDLVHTKYTYPQILHETARVATKIITEQRGNETFRRNVKYSRVLHRLPSGYLILLERIIEKLSGKIHNTLEKEQLVADILDNLAHNFGLTPNQILKSYTFYRNQNKLKNLVKK